MFDKIIVCFDGSDHAERALRIAVDIAGKYGSELQIVHVPELRNDAVAVGSEVIFIPVDDSEIKALAQQVIDKAVVIAADAGHANVSTKVLRGAAAEAILQHAKDTGTDLIIAGRRGFGTLRGLLVGSVSQKLTTHAECPVLTVQ
ncbi:universal stress protein [Loktanella salsilacus]|uniref:universal stress protein n=1 Tax=Loktanella salsilacus TaxID=195913 RepID=UPI003736412E